MPTVEDVPAAESGTANRSGVPSRPTRVGAVARVLFLVAALALAAVALHSEGSKALHDVGRVGAPRIALAFLAATAGLYASGFAWRALLAGVGGELPVRPAFDVFFVGQLGKYVPGSVFAVVGQVQRARGVGVGRSQVGAAAILTMVMNIATGALVAVATLPFADAGVVAHHPEIIAALPIGLVLLHPRVFGPAIDWLLRRLGRAPMPQRPDLRSMGRSIGWSIVMWLLYGLHTWLLADGLGGHGGRLLLLAIGSYALSWVAGFLVVIAPAGLGVREAALVLGLRSVLPASAALAVSVLSRLLMTLADVLLALVSLLLGRASRTDA